MTKNQSLVLTVLQSSDQPLGAYSILDRLHDHGLKPPLQVYRALDKLLEAGRVHRLESMNAFVVCCIPGVANPPSCHRLRICEACGKDNELHNTNIEDALIKDARSSGFKIRSTTIEVHGLCAACH